MIYAICEHFTDQKLKPQSKNVKAYQMWNSCKQKKVNLNVPSKGLPSWKSIFYHKQIKTLKIDVFFLYIF